MQMFCMQWVFFHSLDEQSQEDDFTNHFSIFKGSTMILIPKSTYHMAHDNKRIVNIINYAIKAYQQCEELTTHQNTLWYIVTQTIITLIIVKPC